MEASVERAAQGVNNKPTLEFLWSPKGLLINGKWTPAKSDKTFETINPATKKCWR
jgi:hypothetical protein